MFTQLSAAAQAYTKNDSVENLQAVYDVAADLALARQNGLLNQNQSKALDSMAVYNQFMQDSVSAAMRRDSGQELTKAQAMTETAFSKLAAAGKVEDYQNPNLYVQHEGMAMSLDAQLESSSKGVKEQYEKLRLAEPDKNGYIGGFKQTLDQLKDTVDSLSNTDNKAGYPHNKKELTQEPVQEPERQESEKDDKKTQEPAPESNKHEPMPSPMGGRKGEPSPDDKGFGASEKESEASGNESRSDNVRAYIETFSHMMHDSLAVDKASKGQPSVPWEEETPEVRQAMRGQACELMAGLRAAGYGFDFSKPPTKLPMMESDVKASRPDGSQWSPQALDFKKIPPLSEEQKKEAEALSKDDIWKEFDRQAQELNQADSAGEAQRVSDMQEAMRAMAEHVNQGFQVNADGASPMGQAASAMYEHGTASGMPVEEPGTKRPGHDMPSPEEVSPVASIYDTVNADMQRPLPPTVKEMALEQYSAVLDPQDMAVYQGTVRAIDKLSAGYKDIMSNDSTQASGTDVGMSRILSQYHDLTEEEAVKAAMVSTKLDGDSIQSEHAPGSDAWNKERDVDIQAIMNQVRPMRAAGELSTIALARGKDNPNVMEALQGTLSRPETAAADRGHAVAGAALDAAYDRVVDLEDTHGYVPDEKTKKALGPMYEDYRTSRRAAENQIGFEEQRIQEQRAQAALSSPQGVREMMNAHALSSKRARETAGMDTNGMHDTVAQAVAGSRSQAKRDGIAMDLMLRGMMQRPNMDAQKDEAGKAYRDYAEKFYNKHLEPDAAAAYHQDMFNAKAVLGVMNQAIVDAAQASGKERNANGRYSVGSKELVSHLTKDLNQVDLKQGADVQGNNKMLRDMMDKATLLGECSSAGSRAYAGKDGGVAQSAVRNTLTRLDGKLLDAAGGVAVKMQDEVYKKAAAMEMSGQKLDKETKKALGPEYARQKKDGLFDKVRQEYADKGQTLEKPSRLSGFMSSIQNKIKSMAKDAAKESPSSEGSRQPDTEAFQRAFGQKEAPSQEESAPAPGSGTRRESNRSRTASARQKSPEKVHMSEDEQPKPSKQEAPATAQQKGTEGESRSAERDSRRPLPHGYEDNTGPEVHRRDFSGRRTAQGFDSGFGYGSSSSTGPDSASSDYDGPDV